MTDKNTLWGGRFESGPDSLMTEINASIDVDRRFRQEDLTASEAHCEMLLATGILSRETATPILEGLKQIREEMNAGTFPFREEYEDIHMNVEARLKELIGPAAGYLHTARSRNDQVATDFHLWIRGATDSLISAISDLQKTLIDKAETHAESVMPGFTHLQPAQPVTFGHYLLAYNEMLARDRDRFADARRRGNECPLGAAALAGTSFPVDREKTAAALGFDRPSANSLDAVSDRDFVLDFLSAAAICATHLSRIAEEIVIFTTPQFGFLSLPDAFSTGSSIMPQKRNPDAAELIRGRTGRAIGALNTLLVTLKGLPLAYSKDMQEDKPPAFSAFDSLLLCLRATTGMIADMTVHTETMRAAASVGFSTATDLADWLVRQKGLSFRDAHHRTGTLVKMAEEDGTDLLGLSKARIHAACPEIDIPLSDILSVNSSVNSRTSFGGTAPENVRRSTRTARKKLLETET